MPALHGRMRHSPYRSVGPFDFLLCKAATMRYERAAMACQPTTSRRAARFAAGTLAIAVLAGASAALAEDGFVMAIDDLPLMPGLTEVREAGIAFDKPQGRIVEAYAEGAVAGEAVVAFYEKTLPQLGWSAARSPAGDTRWRREGEVLRVDVLADEEPVTVRFYLTPNFVPIIP